MADTIKIERPDDKTIKEMNVKSWPIWTKEPSTFDWRKHYRFG